MELIGTKGTIIAGKVLSNEEGTGAGAGKVRNVKLDVNVRGVHKTITVAFWNNEDKPLAERAKVISADSYVMIYCTVKDGKYTGYNFEFPGHSMKIEVDSESDEPKREVTLGTIFPNTSASGKKFYKIKTSKYYPETNETKDVYVFVNFASKLQENAEKVLAGDGGKMVALVSFPIETTVENDRETNSMVVLSFDRLD